MNIDENIKELENKGYTIIKNVLDDKEILEYILEFNKWMDSIPNLDELHKIIHYSGIFKYFQVGHQRFAWLLRTNPKIQNIFKKIWNTNELVVSFDGCCYYPKNNYNEDRYWIHSDQSGIKKGMPVTQNNSLVGRIVDTNYLSSRVLLLTDLNSRIPVSLDADSSQAILTGSGTKNPKLEYLPEEYEFKEDINVFASGKERIFIPGTPIGKTTEKGEVKLHVDPNQLSFVTVILTRNNKEQF